jgi:hypothetical protein
MAASGFCDVYDLSTQELDRQAILALPESPYTVRLSMPDDAASLLALYGRHFGLFTGSFARSLEQQAHWMHHLDPAKLLLVIDSSGQVRGYLFLAATQARGPYFFVRWPAGRAISPWWWVMKHSPSVTFGGFLNQIALLKRGLVLEYLTLGWNVVGALRKDR